MSGSEPLRRRNHWVPASYLAAFTDSGRDSGLLTVLDRHRPEWQRESLPHAIAFERDLYIVPGPEEGTETDSLERYFGDYLEGPFVRIRNHLAYGSTVGMTGVLTEDERVTLSMYLAAQQLRTPAHRAQAEVFLRWSAEFFSQAALSNPSFLEDIGPLPAELGPAASVLELFESGKLRADITEKAWLQFAIPQLPKIAEIIHSLPHRVVRMPPDIVLPTSDAPLPIVKRVAANTYCHGAGWRDPEAEATLPLSPHTVLVLGGALERYADHDTHAWAVQLRHRIVTGAQRWLYLREHDAAIAALLYSTSAPETEIQHSAGRFRAGDSANADVRALREASAGSDIVRFGPRYHFYTV